MTYLIYSLIDSIYFYAYFLKQQSDSKILAFQKAYEVIGTPFLKYIQIWW